MNSIEERIKYLRKDILSKTQKDFGLQIGLKPNSVSDIENGKNNPTDQTIKAICREFNINEEWLRTGTPPMKTDQDIEFSDICFKIGVQDEKAKNAIMNYWKLSESDRRLFWGFLEKIIQAGD